MSKIMNMAERGTPVVLQGRGFTPGGEGLALTPMGSVGCPCSTGFTCQTMEMLCSGKLSNLRNVHDCIYYTYLVVTYYK